MCLLKSWKNLRKTSLQGVAAGCCMIARSGECWTHGVVIPQNCTGVSRLLLCAFTSRLSNAAAVKAVLRMQGLLSGETGRTVEQKKRVAQRTTFQVLLQRSLAAVSLLRSFNASLPQVFTLRHHFVACYVTI